MSFPNPIRNVAVQDEEVRHDEHAIALIQHTDAITETPYPDLVNGPGQKHILRAVAVSCLLR